MQWHAQVFRELWKLVTSVQTLMKPSSQQIHRNLLHLHTFEVPCSSCQTWLDTWAVMNKLQGATRLALCNMLSLL